jgi:hypothetical protein
VSNSLQNKGIVGRCSHLKVPKIDHYIRLTIHWKHLEDLYSKCCLWMFIEDYDISMECKGLTCPLARICYHLSFGLICLMASCTGSRVKSTIFYINQLHWK